MQKFEKFVKSNEFKPLAADSLFVVKYNQADLRDPISKKDSKLKNNNLA